MAVMSKPCETCGECEYYEDGGFFYCQECNTQSQGMRLIEASVDQFNFTGAQRSIYQKVDQCVGEKEKGEPDFGIPWTTHDAFALLLQAQSVELVKLGAPASFPLLVEKLWRRYESRRAGTPKPRDRDVIEDQSKGVAPVSKWRAYRKRRGKWPSTVDPNGLSREERKEWKVHNGLSEEQAEEEEEENDSVRKKRRKQEWDTRAGLKITRRTAKFHIQRMRLEYSLCFIYIALLNFKCTITLGDILRWTEQSYIPFLNPLEYFPENMKFSDTDIKTFAGTKRVPSSHQLRVDTGRLIVFLQLFPHPAVDIKGLVARYVLDLNLPNVIIRQTFKLMSAFDIVCPPYAPRKNDTNTIIIPNYEAIAITAVLTSLKFIFRLDGVTEFAFSHLMRELDEKVNPRSKLALPSYFDFEKWFHLTGFLSFYL